MNLNEKYIMFLNQKCYMLTIHSKCTYRFKTFGTRILIYLLLFNHFEVRE